MSQWLDEIGGFLWAVISQWQTLVGGVAFTALGLLIERRRGKEIDWTWYRRLLVGCLAIATFLAWQEERRGKQTSEKDRAALTTNLAAATTQIETLRHQTPLKVEVQQESPTQAAELMRRQLRIEQLERELGDARRQLDDRQRRGTTLDTLVTLAQAGSVLRDRCLKERCPDDVEKAARAWYVEALRTVTAKLGTGYAERFKNVPSYTTQPGDFPYAKLNIYNAIRGRVDRLHEFIKELQQG